MREKTTLLAYSLIIIGLLLVFLNSCEKDDPKSLAVLTTTGVTEITQTTAISGGNISNDGGAPITSRGICWSTNQSPTITDSKIASGSDTGSFTANLTGLTAGSSYYVRAYATNSVGTSYGSAVSFTTLKAIALATITTTVATDVSIITQTTAVFAGKIPDDGGAAITTRGVCWSTKENPTINDNKTVDGTGTGSFTSNITGLLPNTTYHVRVYATNSKGTSYGNPISFTTLKAIELATITTTVATDISEISQTTAVFVGKITDDGGADITARGICWSTKENPTINDNKTTNGTGTGSFTGNITGLAAGTNYHVRVYATNSKGTSYGNNISFSTLKAIALPTISAAEATDISEITQTSAVFAGEITDDGGSLITARGLCWSTKENPTISDSKTTNGTGTGSFTGNITGIAAGTTYHVRVYATNSKGTSYGNDISFTTLKEIILPAITKTEATDITEITETTAIIVGKITEDGGAAVTARGVCWSTKLNPTISDSKTTNGTGTGNFTSNITGLLPNTTYHVRVYATNIKGTSYGNDISFTTPKAIVMATLTTAVVTEVTQTTANSGGNITDDGGAPITARGVCWSKNNAPSINDSKTMNGTGTGSFSSNITGLVASTTYYVRAYATNSKGTSYGNVISFNTQQGFILGSFTDVRDGNVYKTTTIGAQVWMAENLKYLPEVAGPGTGSETVEVYYVYDYDGNNVSAAKATSNYNTYGVLYNWPAAMAGATSTTSNPSDVQGACPTGWHLPSDAEWDVLNNFLGGYLVAGGKLKEMGTTHWANPNNDATNEAGFTALPGGYRFYLRQFNDIGTEGNWWSATQLLSDDIWVRIITNGSSSISRSDSYREHGYSIRCVKSNNAIVKPSITSAEVSSVTETTAISGGKIINDGGATVTARGVCWSKSSSPTISDSKTVNGNGRGTFISNITDLTPSTTYYVRAYATNSAGTSYGSSMTFTTKQSFATIQDVEGNVYKIVTLGTQTWMAENLKTTKFKNGANIPHVVDSLSWGQLLTPAYCWYKNDKTTYGQDYGALYNWFTVNTGNLCPTGWHVPSDAEWTTLADHMGGEWVAGSKLKEVGYTYWQSPNSAATNEVGFSARAGGRRFWHGEYFWLKTSAFWWSTDEYGYWYDAKYRQIYYFSASTCPLSSSNDYKQTGLSVRCVKD